MKYERTPLCVQFHGVAAEAFNRFLSDAVQYLRPDGGRRTLETVVTVGKDGGTMIEMREFGVSYNNVLLRAEFKGDL